MRNIVLLCLDTVRKDFFDEYAPRLVDRADVVYDGCRAASSWSAPSHASMFTGQLPSEHGVHAFQRDFSVVDRDDTFLGELPDYRALGASANVWAGSSFGFDTLFDSLSDVSPDQRFPEGIDVARFGQETEAAGLARHLSFLRSALAHDYPLKSLANGAAVQLDRTFQRLPLPKPFDDGASLLERELMTQIESSTEPFFGFVNFMDAHGPVHHARGYDRSLHDAPLSWTARTVDLNERIQTGDEQTLGWYRDLYGTAIDYLDRRVVDFVDRIQRVTDRKTTVVVTADHGNDLALTDERYWGHTATRLTEALLHVPLVVLNAPGEYEARQTECVSHLSLPALLVGIANEEVPDITGEMVRAERIGNSGPPGKLEAGDVPPEENMVIRALYGEGEKYVWDHHGSGATYRLDPDRPSWETKASADLDVDQLDAAFETDIETIAKQTRSTDPLDIDNGTADRLRELGYL
ncbi:sulfatase-like hydrolase/transferase [Natrinema halophilum]|uniref:Sulfatase-like hydrolase/transferase n=1 Tax=Natrinema halophilum TaxID=1699371 RepID=A0A7D5GK22_9EURY|nr:sulfatase-like hydrolase/transferase [Natrinema halophilum]QLG48890.1 sulfatase-like hydrolase/transferase [Natrinema halophilum]